MNGVVMGAIGGMGAPLSAVGDKAFVSGFQSGGSGAIGTDTITVTARGGAGGYTYSWARVSGDVFSIGSSTAAATDFAADPGPPPSTKSAVYRCTVTDAATDTVTVDVNVDVTREP